MQGYSVTARFVRDNNKGPLHEALTADSMMTARHKQLKGCKHTPPVAGIAEQTPSARAWAHRHLVGMTCSLSPTRLMSQAKQRDLRSNATGQATIAASARPTMRRALAWVAMRRTDRSALSGSQHALWMAIHAS